MSTIPYALVNGVYTSWPNIEIRVKGLVCGGITEINYSPKLDPGDVRGAGAQPIGMTIGQASYEGDFSILEPQWYQLLEILDPNKQGYGMTVFDIVVGRSPVGDLDNFETVQDELIGCRITAAASSGSATSTDGLVKKCTIKMLRILEAGHPIGPASPTADI